MQKKEIVEALGEAGLGDKESETYIALLELGQSTVSKVSQRTGINRITSYGLINSLLHKGFVVSSLKDKIQNFSAIEPRKILALLKQKERKIELVMPGLESLTNLIDSGSSVALYEGKKGIIDLLRDVLDNAKTVYVYGNREIAEKIIEFESLNFRKERLNREIKLVGLSNVLEEYIATDKNWRKYSDLRILKSLDVLSTWTMIYGDKVAILTFKKELKGIIIQNQEVADTQKFFFDMLWKQGKKA